MAQPEAKRLPVKRVVAITLAVAWTLLLTLYLYLAGADSYLTSGAFAVAALTGGTVVLTLEKVELTAVWHDIRGHMWAVVPYLVWWLAVLAAVVASEIDRLSWGGFGTTVDVITPYMLVGLALVAGVLLGWWRATAPEAQWRLSDGVWSVLLAGVTSLEAVALAYIGLYRLVGTLTTRLVESISPLWPLEAVGYTTLAGAVGSALGALGGLIGGLSARAGGKTPRTRPRAA